MKKIIGTLAAFILFSGLGFAQTVQKGQIGRQDLNQWDGSSTTTFSRKTSTGGTVTLFRVGNEVDPLSIYGSGPADANDSTLSKSLALIQTSPVIMVLSPGTWNIANSLTIPANVRVRVPAGALITVASTKTLTISGSVEAGPYRIFYGTGTATVAMYPQNRAWWGEAARDEFLNYRGTPDFPYYDARYRADGTVGALNDGQISYALAAIGTVNQTTLVLTPGTWVISQNKDWSAYANVTFSIMPGAYLSHGTYTLNIPNVTAGSYQIFVGTGQETLSGSLTQVYAEWWGADSSGVADSSAAWTRAINCGLPIIPPENSTYRISSAISLPAKDVTIRGNGHTTFNTAAGNAIFYTTRSGYKFRLSGVQFTGNGIGYSQNSNPATRTYHEYDISDCIFNQSAGVYGISLVGAGPGFVTRCQFTTCNGIYAKQSDFRVYDQVMITGSQVGIFDDGTRGTDAYSTGSRLVNSLVMSCTLGIHIKLSEDFLITGSTIDYNTQNVLIEGQYTGTISNNYMGDNGGNPSITIQNSGAVQSTEIKILGNEIVGHWYSAATYDAIVISNSINSKIVDNSITFYTRYGISYNTDVNLKIINNYISPRPTYGTYAIYSAADSTTNRIAFNDMTQTISGATLATIFQNVGYETEANDTATIAAGNTSVTVTHGLNYTPTESEIQVTPQNTWGTCSKWWIGAPTATTFVIACDAAPGGPGLYFSWRIIKKLR